jgi:hypothetical protein
MNKTDYKFEKCLSKEEIELLVEKAQLKYHEKMERLSKFSLLFACVSTLFALAVIVCKAIMAS